MTMPAYVTLRGACEVAGLKYDTVRDDPKHWFPHARQVGREDKKNRHWRVPVCCPVLLGEDHESPKQRWQREQEEAAMAAPAPFSVVRSGA